jgi:hypothetical protein
MTANNRTGQKMAGQTEKDTDRARTGAGTGKGMGNTVYSSNF